MKTNCDNCKHEIRVDNSGHVGVLLADGLITTILCQHCAGSDPSGEEEEEAGIIVGVRI